MSTDKDYFDLTDVPPHRQGFVLAEHQARWRLDEALQQLGLNTPSEQLFLNAVNNLSERLVTASATLPGFIAQCVVDAEPPAVGHDLIGVFTAPHTFLDEHRVDPQGINQGTVAAILSDVYDQLIG